MLCIPFSQFDCQSLGLVPTAGLSAFSSLGSFLYLRPRLRFSQTWKQHCQISVDCTGKLNPTQDYFVHVIELFLLVAGFEIENQSTLRKSSDHPLL